MSISQIAKNRFNSVKKDKALNSLHVTDSLKLPTYSTLPDPRYVPGLIAYQTSDTTFYGSDGFVWMPFGIPAPTTTLASTGGGESLVNGLQVGPTLLIKSVTSSDSSVTVSSTATELDVAVTQPVHEAFSMYSMQKIIEVPDSEIEAGETTILSLTSPTWSTNVFGNGIYQVTPGASLIVQPGTWRMDLSTRIIDPNNVTGTPLMQFRYTLAGLPGTGTEVHEYEVEEGVDNGATSYVAFTVGVTTPVALLLRNDGGGSFSSNPNFVVDISLQMLAPAAP